MFLRTVLLQALRNVTRVSFSSSPSKVLPVLNSYRNSMISNRIVKQTNYEIPASRQILRWDVLTTILIFLGVIEDLEKAESPLILEIKRGILARQRHQYLKADRHFHIALQLAQDQKYSDAETYIFDCMADNYLEQNQFEQARDLYLEVIRRLQDNLKPNELIEISCKLAHCYSNTGNDREAEMGFQFAIDSVYPETQSFFNDKTGKILVEKLAVEQTNLLALLGMCYDYYSKHLENIHLKFALSYKLKALNISTIINGNQEQQTLVLHNDIASIYAEMEQFEQAKKNLGTAIDGAKVLELSELPVFYVNLAAIHHKEERADLARQQCLKAQDFLLKYKSVYNYSELQELFGRCDSCIRGDRFY